MAKHKWDDAALDILRSVYPARGPRAVCAVIEDELGWRPSPASVTNQASLHGVRRDRFRTGHDGACELSATRFSAPATAAPGGSALPAAA